MLKHANRGAFPVMVVLGVLIGGSLAMVSPLRSSEALSPPATLPVVVSPQASGNDGAGEEHQACARGMATFADGDLLLSRVLMTCTENPQARRLVDSLFNPPPGDGKPSGGSASTDEPAAAGAPGGTGSGGSSDSGGAGAGIGSGGGGSGGSGSTGGENDNNGKAVGQSDGKGNNG